MAGGGVFDKPLGVGDINCAKKRPPGSSKTKQKLKLGMRWPLERTNSWFTSFGQLRLNTDRYENQRLSQIAVGFGRLVTGAGR